MRSTHADVIILGAGAAGLAAAHHLRRAAVDVLVLEARDRIGGRIHSIDKPGWPVPIELGAEFIHGRPQATWKIVRAANLVPCEVAENHWHLWRGRVRQMDDFWGRMQCVIGGVKRIGRRDISFAEYLDRCVRANSKDKSLAGMFVEGFDAAHLDRISAKSLAAEQEQGGEDASQYRLIGGYGRVLRYLCDEVVSRSMHLRTLARHIRWRRGQVEVLARMRPDPKAKSYRAQRLIVTLPIALLQQAGDSRGLIHFDPEIPDKRRAAGMLSLGPVVKIVLLFREPFWERSKLKGMSFMHWREGAFRTWWTTLPLRTAVLSGWAGGPVAERLRGLDRREVLDRAITTLSKITSFSSARIRSLLLESHLYDWQADMLSRGAYSYVNVGGQSARAQLARPIEGTLFFAGEATDTSGEAGTVAGALASGHRAARQLLRAMRHRKAAVG